jgi:hypothetical protein
VRVRSDRLAEGILLLVAQADRAAAAVGDLMEESGARGRLWFWWSVARLACSLVVRDLGFSPIAMVASSVVAWFLYMGLSVVLAFVGYVVVTFAWGLAYVITHHTGLELLADALRLRFDWPPIPAWTTYAIQAVVLVAVAPFQLGRGSTAYWRGHELTLVVVMLLVWSAMSVLVPFVGVGISASPPMMPAAVMFVLAGALSERFRSTPTSS